MKKFALLGAVAALATAGGVFAAWQFDNTTVDSIDSKSITVTVTDSSDREYQGTGNLELSGDLTMSVNRVDTGSTFNKNYYEVTIVNTLKVTYTAPAGDTDDLGAKVVVTASEIGVDGYFTIGALNQTLNFATSGEEDITSPDVNYTKNYIETEADFDAFIANVDTLEYTISFATSINE